MRLFKKKNEEKVLGWNDITVKDLFEIKGISELQMATEDEKNLKVVSVVTKVPYDQLIQMPLGDVSKYVEKAKFLYEEPKPRKARHSYTINGRRYNLLKNEGEMITSQYIDFQAVYRDGFEKRPGELLSVMMVPAGHEYNDGYDKDLVINDMYDMWVEDALGIIDFFTKRFVRLIARTKTFCKLMMRWKRLTAKKEDREMLKALEIQMNLILDEATSMCGFLALKPYHN